MYEHNLFPRELSLGQVDGILDHGKGVRFRSEAVVLHILEFHLVELVGDIFKAAVFGQGISHYLLRMPEQRLVFPQGVVGVERHNLQSFDHIFALESKDTTKYVYLRILKLQ